MRRVFNRQKMKSLSCVRLPLLPLLFKMYALSSTFAFKQFILCLVKGIREISEGSNIEKYGHEIIVRNSDANVMSLQKYGDVRP